jgi:hypothetical protein
MFETICPTYLKYAGKFLFFFGNRLTSEACTYLAKLKFPSILQNIVVFKIESRNSFTYRIKLLPKYCKKKNLLVLHKLRKVCGESYLNLLTSVLIQRQTKQIVFVRISWKELFNICANRICCGIKYKLAQYFFLFFFPFLNLKKPLGQKIWN